LCEPERGWAGGFGVVSVSPDSKSLYVGAIDSVAVFARNTTSGALTQTGGPADCLATEGYYGGCGVARGLHGITSIAVSPDNKSVYVGSSSVYAYTGDAGYIAIFSRSLAAGSVGQLSQAYGPTGCYHSLTAPTDGCAEAIGIDAPDGIAISPADTRLYVSSADPGTVTTFIRKTT
ncbi:MAG: Lactonase, 7-bladed beta-propeller, partial [Pseudonocardiales bacterium]|nr:Lactonase, 7-bladed beta-propeller [Pseudonocardiales bacterium]